MKLSIFFTLCMFLTKEHVPNVSEKEQQLTGGKVKRWIYEKTTPLLGVECSTSILSFDLSSHRYNEIDCKKGQGRDMVSDIARSSGSWKITQNQDGEYILSMKEENYVLDIYKKTYASGESIKTLRLRTVSIDMSTETSDRFYYEE